LKTYFVFSDVHGFYLEWQDALLKAGFDENNPEHILISCGDLLDRGRYPMDCLRYINRFHRCGRAICIRGNHEDLLEEVFKRKEFLRHDYSNGTAQTCVDMVWMCSFDKSANLIERASLNEDYKEYSNNLVDYYELGNYIFVHGWIPCQQLFDETTDYDGKYLYEENWKDGSWSEARWTNGMKAWSDGVKIPNKTIVCGHYHTSWGHRYIDNTSKEFAYSDDKEEIDKIDFSPFVKDGIIALDACTAYSGKVNVYVIEEDKINFND